MHKPAQPEMSIWKKSKQASSVAYTAAYWKTMLVEYLAGIWSHWDPY